MTRNTTSTANGTQNTWGKWTFNEERRVLRHQTRPGYDVYVDRMRNAAATLDWIMQVTGKRWVSREDAGDLIEAIRYLVRPQATQCSGAMCRRPDENG